MIELLDDPVWRHLDVDPGGCWIYTGFTNADGYGVLLRRRVRSTTMLAHRYVYELLVGPIPDVVEGNRMSTDHLCRVRPCCNPDHIEVVRHAVNIRRGTAAAIRGRQSHCKRGHPLSGPDAEVYLSPDGRRCCRPCGRIHQANYRGRKVSDHH